MDTSSLLGLLAVLLLVAANGFFVAGEFALVKVRKTRIDQLVSEGKRVAKTVQRQIEHLDKYIAATQLGITLASLALGWVGEPALGHLIEPLFVDIAGPEGEAIANTVAIVVSFSLITIFHIVLGELVPKSIALQRAEGTALFISRPLYIFARVFGPFVSLMNGLGGYIVKLIGLRHSDESSSVHSVEELEMLVTQSREAGVLDNQEEVLLRRVFDFGDKTANQVMMPRTEIIGVPKNITLEKLVEVVAEEHYTRFPVYDETLDNILGILHVKDLFALLAKYQTGSKFDVLNVMRDVLKVPETVLIEDLLTLMKTKQAHMVVVIDEYGGTAGIVTFEDILEEIVGEVQDEFDTREEGARFEVEPQPDGSFSVNGLMTVSDFAERFGVSIQDTNYETIAGYVFGELGRPPRLGEEILIGDYRVLVDELDNLRIARLKVELIKKEEETTEELPEEKEVAAKGASNNGVASSDDQL